MAQGISEDRGRQALSRRKRDRQGSEAGQCAAGLWYGKIQMLLQPDESPTMSEVVEMQAAPARSLSSPWPPIKLWFTLQEEETDFSRATVYETIDFT